MLNPSRNQKYKVPYAMVAYIHDTTKGAVQNQKFQPTPIHKEYLATEKRIQDFIEKERKHQLEVKQQKLAARQNKKRRTKKVG